MLSGLGLQCRVAWRQTLLALELGIVEWPQAYLLLPSHHQCQVALRGSLLLPRQEETQGPVAWRWLFLPCITCVKLP